MALVYRAYHPQLDRYVALKLLRFDLADETAFLARSSARRGPSPTCGVTPISSRSLTLT